MIILPFADDIRHLKVGGTDDEAAEKNIASHEQVNKAKALINKLAFVGRFDSDTFDNPVLQSHYANLQSLALDQELEGHLQDYTLPPYDRIKMRAEAEIVEFKESIGLQNVEIAEPKTAKRSAAVAANYDPIAAIAACKTDPKALSKFTVADLKNYLESIGVKAKRVKSEIIEQVLE